MILRHTESVSLLFEIIQLAIKFHAQVEYRKSAPLYRTAAIKIPPTKGGYKTINVKN